MLCLNTKNTIFEKRNFFEGIFDLKSEKKLPYIYIKIYSKYTNNSNTIQHFICLFGAFVPLLASTECKIKQKMVHMLKESKKINAVLAVSDCQSKFSTRKEANDHC